MSYEIGPQPPDHEPETPDPPPVSPDPWKAVDAHRAFILVTTERQAVYDLCVEVDAARAADAALLRERDAQIASLTAQVEGLQDKWTGGWTRETALAQVDDFDRLCQTIATLRAERDAAQQQIATLTEALQKADEALNRLMSGQDDCGDPFTECPMHDAHKPWHPVQEALTLIAALQSTRPQEQP